MTESAARERMRRLPSVEATAAAMPGPPRLVVTAAREAIESVRQRILDGEEIHPDVDLIRADAAARLRRMRSPSLVRVINATGVILHTNLGRAPLPRAAVEAIHEAARGYSNLELDLVGGGRGSRHEHVEACICELSGAEAGIAVNNNAAAVLLALAATAAGREVITSRGELIEIGGSFRIPEILAQSGARLVEVGTTNRTRLSDYEAAIGAETAAILRVHQSNFRTLGFVEGVSTADLAKLSRERGLVLIDDLGSGAIDPVADEPALRDAVGAGPSLVCCSADKLLGGPQAGIIAGRRRDVDACRSHPLARALRLDKLQLAALEATLRLHREGRSADVPAIAMLHAGAESLEARAKEMAAIIGDAASVTPGVSRAGGGALPTTELSGPVCAVRPGELGPDGVVAGLREVDPPVIARVDAGRVILDPRTMTDDDARVCAQAVREVLAGR